MQVYIKNSDTVNHIYQGQNIAPSAYYLVQSSELKYWQEDADLIKDIASGIAVVSKNNATSDEFSDINDGINYLKQFNQLQRHQTILSQDGRTRRPIGHKFTATKNSITEHYFLIDEAISIRGGSLEVDKHVFGDFYSFDVVDKDGNVYAAGTVVSPYIKSENIRKSGLNELEDESISEPIPANLFYFRLTYNSTGTIDDVIGALNITTYL